MEKFLLFYSNYCHYSKTLLEEIKKKEIEEIFLFICVDTNIYTIPSFVDRVPMVYQKNSKQIYIEDSIIDLINHISSINKNKSSNNSNNNNNNNSKSVKFSEDDETIPNSKEEIESYSQVEMNNNFSDNFSFLDNNSQKRSFVFIENDKYNENMISNTNQQQPQSNNNTNDGQSKIDSSAVEKYMMQRDADFTQAMQNMKK